MALCAVCPQVVQQHMHLPTSKSRRHRLRPRGACSVGRSRKATLRRSQARYLESFRLNEQALVMVKSLHGTYLPLCVTLVMVMVMVMVKSPHFTH